MNANKIILVFPMVHLDPYARKVPTSQLTITILLLHRISLEPRW